MTRIKQIYTAALCCEPIVRRMPNGELLCVCQSGDTYEPAPGNRVYVFHSKDNGETWTPPESIYPEDGQAVYSTEVMVLDDEIHVFLTVHNGRFVNWSCQVMKSTDNGYTWENTGAPPHFPTYTFFRGMIRLKNGDILIPYQHYPVTQEENDRLLRENKGAWEANIDFVESGVIISRDGGHTYEKCKIPVHTKEWAWTEPTIVELTNGMVVMLFRICGSGFLWESRSSDGGKTWSKEVKTDIPNPTNKPKLIAMDDGRIALIHTPNNKGIETKKWTDRYPLQIWISTDDMATWEYKKTVTEFPGNYDYADGFFEDGHILFSIERNRHDILFFDHVAEV